jgi:tetratricopeptide (TPR) repeat protein
VITRWPTLAEAYAGRAVAAYHKGPRTAPEIRADIDKVIQYGAADAVGLITRTRQLAADTDVTLVASVLDERLARDPKDVAAAVARAAADIAAGRLAAALERFNGVLALPQFAAKEAAPARVLLLRAAGDVAFQAGKSAEALGYYDQILAVDPNDLESLNNAGYLLAEELGKPAEGLPRAERAVRAMQGRPIQQVITVRANVLDSYGWVLFRDGERAAGANDPATAKKRFEDARAALQQAVELDPQPLTYYHLASVLEKSGMADDARRAADDGIRLAQLRKDPSEKKLTELQARLKSAGAKTES